MVKSNRKLATLICCVLVLGLAVAQGSSDRTRLGESKSISLPPYAILDENAQPLIASTGKVGFVSSVTAGSLISFSTTSGKVLSSVVVGQTAGPASMIEAAGRRIIAVPAVNNPRDGHPATVSLIDGNSPRQLDLIALLVLPADAEITPSTRALLSQDGKFCFIASSFSEPSLLSFDVETGQLLSRLALLDRPSEIALYDGEGKRMVAVASSASNTLSVVRVGARGDLSLASMFSPSNARFDESNNPVFSGDGRSLYIAASDGDRLFGIDSNSGAEFASISIASPVRVAVTTGAEDVELVAVSRIRRPANGKPGGCTVVSARRGQFATRAEFTPPEGIEFSRSNNPAFDPGGSSVFIGSNTGILFAFSAETGDLESHQQVGQGLHRIALSEPARKVAAVRSGATGDEIVMIGFDLVATDEPDSSSPRITALKPDTVEQGRLKSLHLVVVGENLGDDSSLLVNGAVEIGGDSIKGGKALAAKLRRSFFDQAGDISVQVRAANGALSEAAVLRVRRPNEPVIERIIPEEVPGPAGPFTLKVKGDNFRASSTISLGGKDLDTEHRSDTELRALVPAEFVQSVGILKVRVDDLALPDLVSNEQPLNVFGPRITDLKPLIEPVVAGDGSFKLRIGGENFRGGATVEINGNRIAASRVRRLGSKAIKVGVPGRLVEDAGKLAVVVRNPEGSASEPKELEALGPEITSFDPGQILAGTSDVKVRLGGTNFRKGARVYVANSDTKEAFKVDRRQVHFRSSSQIVVTFADKLNDLIAQPATLSFQVVNANSGDGVPSAGKEVKVAGPEITKATVSPAKGDPSQAQLEITGANFRKGALIEFFDDEGAVYVRQRVPDKIRDDRIIRVVSARKAEAWRNLKLRVVNPQSVKSNAVTLDFEVNP